VHDEKVVKIEEIESSETEETRERGFPIAILFDQLERCAVDTDAQVDGSNDRAVDQSCLREDQQEGSSVESQDSQLTIATSSSSLSAGGGTPGKSVVRSRA